MKQLLSIGIIAAVLVVFAVQGGNFAPRKIDPVVEFETKPAAAPKVVVTVLYSPEKREWFEWARDRYTHIDQDAEIKLIEMGSVESAEAIVTRKAAPVVWSPSSRAVLQHAAARWLVGTGAHPLFADAGDAAPQSLARTMLVLVTWKSRAKLLHTSAQVPEGKLIETLLTLATTASGWQALGGPAEWGQIKLDYPDPLRSAVGLDLLYLVALAQAGFPARLDPHTLDTPRLSETFHAMAPEGSELQPNAQLLMTDLLRYGATRHDIIVSYESLALASARENPDLAIIYPPVAIWSDNPAVVLDLEERSAAEKAEGLRWIHYLRLPEIQREAVRYGLRPADPSAALLDEIEGPNPFTHPSAKRVDHEPARAAPPPSVAVVDKLIEIWTAATATRQ
jgi:hypothetical protein